MKIPHQTTITLAAGLGLLIGASLVQVDSFGSFTMDFVDIGNAGNANDGLSGSTAYGGVSYNYRMGVNEVSEAMIESYNTENPNPDLQITQDNQGDDLPATSVSWNEAARFENWLNTSEGYQAAYNVSGSANTNIALWSSANAWQAGGENLFRHKDAHYFLPSEDEWYKRRIMTVIRKRIMITQQGVIQRRRRWRVARPTPFFSALRTSPTAVSGAYIQKKIPSNLLANHLPIEP